MQHLRQVLGLPASLIPVAAIAVGQPGEQKEPRTRYCEDYVRHEHW
jgi:hypothetical protein